MAITTVFFDLDGTLTDPAEGITNSILYALGKMGFPLPPREELYAFIGPPLTESFCRFCGMSAAQAAEALRLYREYFSVTGLYENVVYDGIPAMLDDLRAAGLRLCLATSKPEIYARKITDRFDLTRRLDFVGGATLTAEREGGRDRIRAGADRRGESRGDYGRRPPPRCGGSRRARDSRDRRAVGLRRRSRASQSGRGTNRPHARGAAGRNSRRRAGIKNSHLWGCFEVWNLI